MPLRYENAGLDYFNTLTHLHDPAQPSHLLREGLYEIIAASIRWKRLLDVKLSFKTGDTP